MTSPVASAEIDLPRAATSWLLIAEAKYTLDTKVAADCRIRWADLFACCGRADRRRHLQVPHGACAARGSIADPAA